MNGIATTETKYYFFGGRRVAMRKNDVLAYLHADHLVSTLLVTAASGGVRGKHPLLARGIAKPLARVAASRKILVGGVAVFTQDTPFDPTRFNPAPCPPHN